MLIVRQSLPQLLRVALVQQYFQMLQSLLKSALHTFPFPLQDGHLLAQVHTHLFVNRNSLLQIGHLPPHCGQVVFRLSAVGLGEGLEGVAKLGEWVGGVKHIQIIIVSCQKWEQWPITIMQTDRLPLPNDMGLFNAYKLDDLLNLQSDAWTPAPPLRLAYHHQHALHLEETPIALFERYAKHELVFAGIMGSRRSGKSLFMDRVAQLCEFSAPGFTQLPSEPPAIWMWNIPLAKGNTRLFLLQLAAYELADSNSPHSALLDLFCLLCQTLLLLAAPTDREFQSLAAIKRSLARSKTRFRSRDAGEDACWPEQAHILLRSDRTPSALADVKSLFEDCPCRNIEDAIQGKYAGEFKDEDLLTAELKKYGSKKKMLSQGWIKQVSGVVRECMEQAKCKEFMGLRMSGANLVKLLVNATQSLNLKGYLSLDKVFLKSTRQLYHDAYYFHTALYNQLLAARLDDEKPFPIDYLLSAFKDSSRQVISSFSALSASPALHQDYQNKLEKYVNDKEQMILAVNKKKSANFVKGAVPALSSQPAPSEIAHFLRKARSPPPSLQQAYLQEIVGPLAAGFRVVEKVKEQQRKENEKMEGKLHQRESQLRELQRQKQKKSKLIEISKLQQAQFATRASDLARTAHQLRSQLTQQQPDQPRKTKSPEQLKQEEAQLREELRRKEKTMADVKSQPPRSQERIQLLSSQIEQKVHKQKELESVLASNIPRLQSIQTIRSVAVSPRKVQTRAFRADSPNIRIIPSPKA